MPPATRDTNPMLRQQIRNRHLEVIGTDIDAKVCTYWCNAVSEGLKNFEDFERSMIQSSQYEKRVLSLFKNACYELLGSDGFDPRMFEDFVRSIKNRKQQTIITADTVDSYIRDTKAFRSKYVPLIKSVAVLTIDIEIPDNVVEAYFQKFRRDNKYDVEALKKELMANVGEYSVSGAVSNKGGQSDDETDASYEAAMSAISGGGTEAVNSSSQAPGGGTASGAPGQGVQQGGGGKGGATGLTGAKPPPSAAAHLRVNGSSGTASSGGGKTNSSSLITSEMQLRLRKRPIICKVKEVLQAFFEVYGRPMFVQEYLRLTDVHPLGDVAVNASVEKWKEAFVEEKPTLCAMMNVISTVYENYLGREITGYAVIDRYLHLFDQAKESTEKLFETVKEELVKTPDYEKAMSNRIAQAYSDTYSIEMSEADTKFVFDKVRQHAIALNDDQMHDFIRKFKDDMDAITNNICDTYMAVYDRVPDPSELAKHVAEYRSRITSLDQVDELNREVESALVSSLEFHDVLKTKLKQKHVAVRQDSMTAATLYSTLEIALSKLREVPPATRSVALVDAIVLQCIEG